MYLSKWAWFYTSTGAIIYNIKAYISKIFHYNDVKYIGSVNKNKKEEIFSSR
jgi:hypothetical protein